MDKSKPPVGGMALEMFLARHPDQAWVGDLLIDQFVMWSRWWAAARRFVWFHACTSTLLF